MNAAPRGENNFAYVLGIETTCDETAAAVVYNGRTVLSNVISSQAAIHRPYGGVVPEIAARRHMECIEKIVGEALTEAGVGLEDINAYAVANGPGLAGALLTGVSFAKALAYAKQKPITGVNHIEAHICANYLSADGKENTLEPPFLSLVASGGHTSLIAVSSYDSYEFLGASRDDAAGEAFDKAARLLGLSYPGGPAIEILSQNGDPEAVRFPRAKLRGENGFDFSFSGLKTAVTQFVEREKNVSPADIAASFQKAVVDALIEKTVPACEAAGFDTVALAGGVAANKCLRESLKTACESRGIKLVVPDAVFCTDNAAMVACRGYYALKAGRQDGYSLNAYPQGA